MSQFVCGKDKDLNCLPALARQSGESMSTMFLPGMHRHTTHKTGRSGFASWVLAGGLLSLAIPALAQLPIRFDNTTGQVGHHMVAQPGVAKGVCGGSWNSDEPNVVRGALPPGLRIVNADIVGTPQQPGRWIVTLRFARIECGGKIYPDQDVAVTLEIKGIAPRRVQ